MNCRFSCARSRQVELEQLQQQNSALSMQLRSAQVDASSAISSLQRAGVHACAHHGAPPPPSPQVDASSARQAAEEARREVGEVRRLQVSGLAADWHAETPRRGEPLHARIGLRIGPLMVTR